ncbi:MAG: restriction endonuclease subunit S [Opitutaceae bacterium]
MDRARLLRHFDTLADTPDAVAKLRELVLSLAVQGRLVPPSPKTEAKPIKRDTQTESSETASEDLVAPYAVPSSWNWIRLGWLAPTFQNGVSSRGDANGVPVVVLRLADIYQRRISLQHTRSIPINPRISPKYALHRGDILVVRVNGSAEIVGNFIPVETDTDAIYCDHFIRMRIEPDRIIPEFITLLGRASVVRQQIQDLFITTAGQKTVNQGHISSLIVPLPPLAEQKRIVARVEELLALCDELEARQTAAREQRTRLVQSAFDHLTAAATPADFRRHAAFALQEFPHLTATPDSIPALRQAILSLAVQGHLVHTNGEQLALQNAKLAEVCLLITDGEHATPPRTATGVPLSTAKNVRDGYLDLATTDWVSLETAQKCWKRCKPQHEDILMVCVGATTGRICRVQNPPDMVLVRSVALIRPDPTKVAPCFLELFLRSPAGQSQVWGGVKQSAQPCLYLGKMGAFDVALPPLAEQQRIVAKVAELMKWCDELEARLAAAQSAAAALLDSSLHALLAPAD